MVKKTVKYWKTLERAEAKQESEGTQEVAGLAEVEENEEEVVWKTHEETQFEEGRK